jgi:predicted PurR-regulated permease PerM
VAKTTPPPITSARWGIRTKRIVSIILFIGTVIGLYFLADLIPLLVVSALLAYLLWPVVNFIDARMGQFLPFQSRSLAVILTFIGLITSVLMAIVLIVPVIFNQLGVLSERLPEIITDIETDIQSVLSHPISINGTPVLIDGSPIIISEHIDSITETDPLSAIVNSPDFDIVSSVGNVLVSLGSPVFNVLGGAITAVLNLTFIIVIMFYLMRDGELFVKNIINVASPAYQGDMRRLFYELSRVWNAYLRGQLILCISVGMAVYVVALVLGLPGAPTLGLISALLEFIPNLGPVLATVPAVLVALLSTSSTFPFLSGIGFALVVVLAWTLVQQLEAIYLTPRVMGGGLDLHPLVVIIALLAGASIGGAVGIILAAPFTATGRIFGQYFYGKLFDVDPFPTPKPYEVEPHRTVLLRLYDKLHAFFYNKFLALTGR